MAKLKILIATDDYWPKFDGGALFEHRLAHGLARRGHDVRVVAPGTSLRNYTEADEPTTIYRVSASSFIFSPRYKVSLRPYSRMKKIIEDFRPDVIHIHNAYKIGLSALKLAKKYHIRTVATNHFMPENLLLNVPLGKLFKKFLAAITWKYLIWFHNRADFVTSPTQTAVDLLTQHGLKPPRQAVSNGIDTEKFHPAQISESLRSKYNLPVVPTIIYLGRVDGEKRLDLLITAFATTLKSGVTGHLLIVGGGTKKTELETLAQKLGIGKSVTFTGSIPEAEKPAIYNLARAFAITSPAELQSIVLLEAMASGLPVIAVDVAALKELVRDEVNGYLVPFENNEILAEKLGRLLTDANLAKRMGEKSREIVMEKHSTEKTFEFYEAIYEKLIG